MFVGRCLSLLLVLAAKTNRICNCVSFFPFLQTLALFLSQFLLFQVVVGKQGNGAAWKNGLFFRDLRSRPHSCIHLTKRHTSIELAAYSRRQSSHCSPRLESSDWPIFLALIDGLVLRMAYSYRTAIENQSPNPRAECLSHDLNTPNNSRSFKWLCCGCMLSLLEIQAALHRQAASWSSPHYGCEPSSENKGFPLRCTVLGDHDVQFCIAQL